MELNERAQELCWKYNIDEQLVKDYLTVLTKDPGNYYYNPMCGTGKTIGIAIAIVANPKLNIVYCASSHARLQEFEEVLEELKIGYLEIFKSTEIFRTTDYGPRVILMTTSMLLQIPSMYMNTQIGNDEQTRRVLVIDEIPKILNKIIFRRQSLWDLSLLLDAFGPTANKMNSAPFRAKVNKVFEEGGIKLLDDIGINTHKYDENDPALDNFNTDAKLFLVYYLKNHVDLSEFDEMAYEDLMNYASRMISVRDLYLNRFSKTLILDATADLYEDALQIKSLVDYQVEKNYKEYIDKIYDLSDMVPSIIQFTSKDDYLNNFCEIYRVLKSVIPPKESSYIVTYNSALYDENNEIKKEVYDFLCNEYGVDNVYVEPNKNYIKITELLNKKNVFIANYNRNRGTNLFKECRNVFLIGEFYLRGNDFSQMINDNGIQKSMKELRLNYAIADAVQEISRGCLRMRNSSNKESIYLVGSQDWIKGVCDYLEHPKDEPHLENDELVQVLLGRYIIDNKDNKRKATYVTVAKLIMADSEWSSPGTVSRFEINQAIEREEIPWRFSKLNKLREIFDELGVDESVLKG